MNRSSSQPGRLQNRQRQAGVETHQALLFMIVFLISAGCATTSNQRPATVGLHCSIMWDKTNDQKVTGYQLTVIDRSRQATNTVRFIPIDTTKISCKDAGADHEGLWDVTVQSCYDKTTCGPPTEAISLHITAK
jgi:hypothetical protein